MKRRTFITSAATAFAVTTGCVGSGPETPDNGPATSPPPTGVPPVIIASSLEPRTECNEPGSATISAEEETVIAEGCIVGKNGCQVAALDTANYDVDSDVLHVRVVTADSSDRDEACTQQLVNRGYRITVEFEGPLPARTTVTHDGVNGEQQAGQSNTGA